MNREKIMQNGIEYYESKDSDILKQVSNIAYLCEGIIWERDKKETFEKRVDELKYNDYTGQKYLEQVTKWYVKGWMKDTELMWRMETMVEVEDDKYKQFIYLLYYEAIKYFMKNEHTGGIEEHISCMFKDDYATKVCRHMEETMEVQKIKREKRNKVCLMKLHYRYDDTRIVDIENGFCNMVADDIKLLINKIPVRNLITFMIISNNECRDIIYENMDESMTKEIEDFKGYSFYLKKEQIVETLDMFMVQLEKLNS